MATAKEIGRKLQGKKPFVVRIAWGEDSIDPDVGAAEHWSTYAFRTEAELLAFVHGVDEAVGWMECTVVDERGIPQE